MLEDKLMNDYKEAIKAKDSIKSSALSFLRSQLKYVAIEKRTEKLEDADCIAVIKKSIKQHQDSIDQFTKGNRMDLVEKEQKELDILKSYIPAQMPVEELKKIIEEVIAATGAASMKDMGKVMKEVTANAAGKADSKLISDLVREKLSK